MIKEVKSPAKYDWLKDDYKIFLGGSIEMGKAIDWQSDVVARLTHSKCADTRNVIIFNPRRNASWKQSITNKKFKGQVDWELDHLEDSNLIVMFLQPGTVSPVSLLEIGLFAAEIKAKKKDMIILCPEGFHRKGNVDIVCQRYGIEQAKNMDDLLKKITERVRVYQPDLNTEVTKIYKRIMQK